MSIIVWVLAGAALGWVGYAYLGFNEARGRVIPMIIGAFGGYIGGKIVAPMFTAASLPGEFSVAALFFAAAVAAVFLAIGNLVHNRWGV